MLLFSEWPTLVAEMLKANFRISKNDLDMNNYDTDPVIQAAFFPFFKVSSEVICYKLFGLILIHANISCHSNLKSERLRSPTVYVVGYFVPNDLQLFASNMRINYLLQWPPTNLLLYCPPSPT